MATTIQHIIEKLAPLITSTHWREEESIEISSVNSPELAQANQVAFVTNPKYLEVALRSSAGVLCFPENSREVISKRLAGNAFRPHFFSKEPELAMRETIQQFFQQTPYINRDFEPLIHATAVIHETAQVGARARIGPFAVIAKGVEIGEEAVIGAHSVIESKSKVGARTVIHPFVYVGHSCDIGSECEIQPHTVIGKEGFGYAHDLKNNHFRIPHLGRVIIEDRVHLGSCVNIDRGTFDDTRIRTGAILDNRIQISHNAVIGENAIITAGFVVAGSTKIGKNFLTGGNSSVTGHIEICDNVQLAALSGVRKAIEKPGAYGGNPLMPMRDYMRFTAALLKLPKLISLFRKEMGDDADTASADF